MSSSPSCWRRTCSIPVSQGGVDDTDFGTREFATLDRDGNLVTFFQWVAR